MPSEEILIRRATPHDIEQLAILEKRHFPAVPGQPHGGYAFSDSAASTFLLEQSDERGHWLVVVAELDETIVGFALAAPFSLPGAGKIDRENMLLQFVAVEADHRRLGIGTRLLAEIERRIEPLRQHAIAAHIPTESKEFYESLGWTVSAPRHGFAWVPHSSFIRADLPDPRIGFPLMAVKILEPSRILISFPFKVVTAKPTLDALQVLKARIDDGTVKPNQLHSDTRDMLRMLHELGTPPSRGAFGQRV